MENILKADLVPLLKEKALTRASLADTTGLAIRNVYDAVKGKPVSVEAAKAISEALGRNIGKTFTIAKNSRTLSPKTVVEHHRLISTVLDQAEKEGLVPFNVAGKATLPKVQKKEVNYFQPEQVAAIRSALEREPIKWRTLVHLLLITGARRGEVLELKWGKVDFDGNIIHICNNVLYSPDQGIYEDTPKTATSDRFIILPLRQCSCYANTGRGRAGSGCAWGDTIKTRVFYLLRTAARLCTRTT